MPFNKSPSGVQRPAMRTTPRLEVAHCADYAERVDVWLGRANPGGNHTLLERPPDSPSSRSLASPQTAEQRRRVHSQGNSPPADIPRRRPRVAGRWPMVAQHPLQEPAGPFPQLSPQATVT
jgi:hypothetical protein